MNKVGAKIYENRVLEFNPIQDGHFRECSGVGRAKNSPLPKICHRYPTMMKLGTVT